VLNSHVAARGSDVVLEPDDLDHGKTGCDRFRSSVCGSVIDNDDLGPLRKSKKTLDSSQKIVESIVGQNHDRDTAFDLGGAALGFAGVSFEISGGKCLSLSF
jgi:hypothetical protein